MRPDEINTFICELVYQDKWRERLRATLAQYATYSDTHLGMQIVEEYVFDLAGDPGGFLLQVTNDFRERLRLDPETIGRAVRMMISP